MICRRCADFQRARVTCSTKGDIGIRLLYLGLVLVALKIFMSGGDYHCCCCGGQVLGTVRRKIATRPPHTYTRVLARYFKPTRRCPTRVLHASKGGPITDQARSRVVDSMRCDFTTQQQIQYSYSTTAVQQLVLIRHGTIRLRTAADGTIHLRIFQSPRHFRYLKRRILLYVDALCGLMTPSALSRSLTDTVRKGLSLP